MKKKIVIESTVKDWKFVTLSENDYDEIGEEISFEEVAKELKCSPELLETIKGSLDDLRYCIHDDLADLYKKTDS